MEKIVTLSDRGQITLPKKIRDLAPAQQYSCFVENGCIVLSPLQIYGRPSSSSSPQSIPSETPPNSFSEKKDLNNDINTSSPDSFNDDWQDVNV